MSDSTLWLDRNRKSKVYEKTGIEDYWIVNLVDRQVELHRDPVVRPASGASARYSPIQIFKPGEFITPLAVPRARVPVADLFV